MRIMWDGCGIIVHPDVEGDEIIAEEWEALKTFYEVLEKIGTINVGKEILAGNSKDSTRAGLRRIEDQDTVI